MTTGVRAAGRASPAPPAALLDEVDEHCRALAAAAAGRTLRVPAEGAEEALRSEGRGGARYDTILSLLCTPQVASLEDYAAGLEQVLAPGGWILMVEPVGLGRGRRSTRRPPRRGHRSPRRRSWGQGWSWGRGGDIVAAVRACGLVVTDVHRREAPSASPRWRRYVVLRARRATPPLEGLRAGGAALLLEGLRAGGVALLLEGLRAGGAALPREGLGAGGVALSPEGP